MHWLWYLKVSLFWVVASHKAAMFYCFYNVFVFYHGSLICLGIGSPCSTCNFYTLLAIWIGSLFTLINCIWDPHCFHDNQAVSSLDFSTIIGQNSGIQAHHHQQSEKHLQTQLSPDCPQMSENVWLMFWWETCSTDQTIIFMQWAFNIADLNARRKVQQLKWNFVYQKAMRRC